MDFGDLILFPCHWVLSQIAPPPSSLLLRSSWPRLRILCTSSVLLLLLVVMVVVLVPVVVVILAVLVLVLVSVLCCYCCCRCHCWSQTNISVGCRFRCCFCTETLGCVPGGRRVRCWQPGTAHLGLVAAQDYHISGPVGCWFG